MKLRRELVDKEVRLVWLDSSVDRVDCAGRDKLPTGRDSLPHFTEWGVLASIKDGVAVLIHSESTRTGDFTGAQTSAYFITRIPEEVIIDIRVLVEDGQGQKEGVGG